MSWKDRYLQGSINDIEIYIDAHELSGGRRSVNHEYPFRDENYVEDLGLKTRSFDITAYVIEPNYFQKRDAVIAELEAGSVIQLTHPYLGSKTVRCTDFRLREDRKKGGYAEFAISFIEAGIQIQPNASINAQSFLFNERNILLGLAKQNFLSDIIVQNVPDFVREGAQQTIQDFAAITDEIFSGGFLNKSTQTQEIIDKTANLANNIFSLLNVDSNSIIQIESLADTIISTISSVFDLGNDADNQIKTMNMIQDLQIELRSPVTLSIQKENSNKTAVKELVELIAVAEQARAVQSKEYLSFNEAIKARSDFVSIIDGKLENSNDDIFNSLRNIKSEIINSVPPSNQNLPRINYIELTQRENALLTSYRLYGTKDRDIEIAARNNLRHPGFIPARETIEILQ